MEGRIDSLGGKPQEYTAREEGRLAALWRAESKAGLRTVFMTPGPGQKQDRVHSEKTNSHQSRVAPSKSRLCWDLLSSAFHVSMDTQLVRTQ